MGRTWTPAVRREEKSRDDIWVVTQGDIPGWMWRTEALMGGSILVKKLFENKMPWIGPSDCDEKVEQLENMRETHYSLFNKKKLSKCKMRCKFHSYATEWVKTEVSITSAHFLEPHSKNICVGFVEGVCSEGMFWKQLRRPCGLGLMETAQPTREDLSPTPQPHVALGTLWASWWKHPLWSRRESADGPSFRLRNPHDRVYTEVQAPSSI